MYPREGVVMYKVPQSTRPNKSDLNITTRRSNASPQSLLPIRSGTSTVTTIQVHHQILNSTHLNPPLLSKSQASIPTHHAIIPPNLRDALDSLPVLNKLGNNTSRRLTSKLAELHRGLGVTRALAHAARTRLQRDDMAWPAEGVDLCRGRGERAARQCAVPGGDSCRHGFVARVDRDCVRGALRVGVLGYHLWEREAGGEVRGDRGAY